MTMRQDSPSVKTAPPARIDAPAPDVSNVHY